MIRLKYKADHDLAGLENGNRLVCMILNKPTIPYSLKIGNEWCRIIHNNQQPICRECNQLGHSRKNALLLPAICANKLAICPWTTLSDLTPPSEQNANPSPAPPATPEMDTEGTPDQETNATTTAPVNTTLSA